MHTDDTWLADQTRDALAAIAAAHKKALAALRDAPSKPDRDRRANDKADTAGPDSTTGPANGNAKS